MGEVYIDPLDQWGFVSYEVSARLSEMNKDNPRLLEWVTIQGRASYIQYRGYRIRDNATPEDIDDPKLKAMYTKIAMHEAPTPNHEYGRPPQSPDPYDT